MRVAGLPAEKVHFPRRPTGWIDPDKFATRTYGLYSKRMGDMSTIYAFDFTEQVCWDGAFRFFRGIYGPTVRPGMVRPMNLDKELAGV